MSLLAVAVAGRGLVAPEDPVLYADDEGFLRSRAAFETTRVYAGRPFKLGEHLARLAGSAERMGLPAVDVDECASLAAAAIAEAAVPDAVLRLYWTAGREGAGRASALALVSAVPPELEELRRRGMKLVSLPLGVDPDLRAAEPWLLGGAKTTSYATNIAAQEEARRRDADDAVFLARGGVVLEGTVTNVWWRRGHVLYTPALELGILAGVTRATLVEEAAGLGYEVREGVFPLSHLAGSEEIFTSSAVREVMPVVALDGEAVAGARPGPAAGELQEALRTRARPR